MFFDTVNKVTDIIMFNSRNLGALIVDERPHVKSWDEPQYSIMNLGIEESYGFGVLNEGQAIAVAKNVLGPPEREINTGQVFDSLDRSDNAFFHGFRLVSWQWIRSTSAATASNWSLWLHQLITR